MIAETFKNGEYKSLAVQWWQEHHPGVVIPELLLSDYGVLVRLDDNEPVAMTHLYCAKDAKMAWLGFTVTDRHSRHHKKQVLDFLHECAENELKGQGYRIAYTAYDRHSLQKLVADRGYIRASDVVEYWKELT